MVDVLRLRGKITLGSGDVALRNAVNDSLTKGNKELILDFYETTGIDSSGLQELVNAFTGAKKKGAKLLLCRLPGNVADILTVTQLMTVFDVYDSVEEAVRAVRPDTPVVPTSLDTRSLAPAGNASGTLKCFLSHNSADKTTAEQLARRLLDYDIDVWLDKWEVLAGESLTSRIAEGINEAKAFVILMSPHSMKAKWVKEELRIALQRRMTDPEFKLVPVLVQDCEIPGFLRDYVYVDWRSPTEETFEFLVKSLRGQRGKPARA